MRAMIVGAAMGASAFTTAFADEIVGRWKTQPGETAAIAPCGNAFCITLKDGDYAGRQVGRITESGDGIYVGSLTNPEDGKTYNGQGKLSGNSLKMSGCVLGGLVCKSQTWRKL